MSKMSSEEEDNLSGTVDSFLTEVNPDKFVNQSLHCERNSGLLSDNEDDDDFMEINEVWENNCW